jgi:hypothetical protein
MKRSFAAEDGIALSLTIPVSVDDGVVRILRDHGVHGVDVRSRTRLKFVR